MKTMTTNLENSAKGFLVSFILLLVPSLTLLSFLVQILLILIMEGREESLSKTGYQLPLSQQTTVLLQHSSTQQVQTMMKMMMTQVMSPVSHTVSQAFELPIAQVMIPAPRWGFTEGEAQSRIPILG